MRPSFVLPVIVFVLINSYISDGNPLKAAPVKKDSPLMFWKVMPQIVEKLKEKFPNKDFEIFIPSLMKEIQQSISVQSMEPQAIPGLISNIIENFFQQLGQKSTTPGAGSGEQDTTALLERDVDEKKPEDKPLSLPDLAFDRDPNRQPNSKQPNTGSKMEDEEEWDDDGPHGYPAKPLGGHKPHQSQGPNNMILDEEDADKVKAKKIEQ